MRCVSDERLPYIHIYYHRRLERKHGHSTPGRRLVCLVFSLGLGHGNQHIGAGEQSRRSTRDYKTVSAPRPVQGDSGAYTTEGEASRLDSDMENNGEQKRLNNKKRYPVLVFISFGTLFTIYTTFLLAAELTIKDPHPMLFHFLVNLDDLIESPVDGRPDRDILPEVDGGNRALGNTFRSELELLQRLLVMGKREA